MKLNLTKIEVAFLAALAFLNTDPVFRQDVPPLVLTIIGVILVVGAVFREQGAPADPPTGGQQTPAAQPAADDETGAG